jgi:hypothetical protein
MASMNYRFSWMRTMKWSMVVSDEIKGSNEVSLCAAAGHILFIKKHI